MIYESKMCYLHRVPRHYIWFLKYYFDYNESDCINVVNILFAEGRIIRAYKAFSALVNIYC